MSFASQFLKFTKQSKLQDRIVTSIESAISAIQNPTNGIHISRLGELTGRIAATKMRDQMLRFDDGRFVLKNKPVIAEPYVKLDDLRKFPNGSLGREYAHFMDSYEFHPHDREAVRYLDDPDLAYVITRYRQIHDFQHTLWNIPVTVEAEVALKVIEMTQTQLPMTALATLFGELAAPTARIVEANEKTQFVYSGEFMKEKIMPWARSSALNVKIPLHCIHIENWFERPVDELRNHCGIKPIPVELRKLIE